MTVTRKCKKCGEVRELKCFGTFKNRNTSGHRHECKYCEHKRHQAYPGKSGEIMEESDFWHREFASPEARKAFTDAKYDFKITFREWEEVQDYS